MKTEAKFTPMELQNWSRGGVFYYFSEMAPTGYSVTVKMDITRMKACLKERGYKFFPAYLWLVTKTLSKQKEFMIAEVEGKLGYYNILTPLYAAFHEDDKTFSLMWTQYDDDFKEFHRAYLEDQKQYGGQHGILSKGELLPPPNAYTVSCLPWVSFEHFATHSYENKAYYFPSIEAGKFYEEVERIWLPLSLTCHHAATDGYHVGRFLDELQKEMNAFDRYL